MTPPPAVVAAPAVRPRRTGRPARGTPVPRRVSGPAKGKSATRASTRAAPRSGAAALPAPGGIALGLVEALSSISGNRWLDRLIRGRAWIGLLAFALIGIVAMQLWIVKLGVGIGRALEHEGLLQRENATLSIEDAKLSSGERVEQMAAARGMVVASPGALRFETVRGGLDARLAAAALARGGQVQSTSSASGSEGTTGTGSTGSEASASQSASTAQGASTATTAASATGSAQSSSGAAEGSSGLSEVSSGSSGGSSVSSESAAPASATSTEAPAAPATGEGGASSSTSTGAGGSTPAVSEAAPGSSAGTVASDGGTQQPAAGG